MFCGYNMYFVKYTHTHTHTIHNVQPRVLTLLKKQNLQHLFSNPQKL